MFCKGRLGPRPDAAREFAQGDDGYRGVSPETPKADPDLVAWIRDVPVDDEAGHAHVQVRFYRRMGKPRRPVRFSETTRDNMGVVLQGLVVRDEVTVRRLIDAVLGTVPPPSDTDENSTPYLLRRGCLGWGSGDRDGGRGVRDLEGGEKGACSVARGWFGTRYVVSLRPPLTPTPQTPFPLRPRISPTPHKLQTSTLPNCFSVSLHLCHYLCLLVFLVVTLPFLSPSSLSAPSLFCDSFSDFTSLFTFGVWFGGKKVTVPLPEPYQTPLGD